MFAEITEAAMTTTTVTAPDGAAIAVESIGTGPGVVVVNGGAVSGKDYRRLARRLADRFTVHLFNRRNRPGSADLPETGYSVQVDIDDIAAVLASTGSTRLIGHSIGGFIALRAAMTLPVDRLALYDPAVQVDNLFPADYLDDFEDAITRNDHVRAVAVVGKGLRAGGRLSDLPMGVQLQIAKLFLLSPIGKQWQRTIHTVPGEAREAIRHGGSADLYAGVTADVLLASGSRSPYYYAPINERLTAAIPKARVIIVPRAGHDAPNRGGRNVATPIADFLA
jgi:pimeloyl-ACP methyl ester carboxylesterase